MNRAPRGGFTIVELLVAIIVLTAGILAVASSTMFSTRNLSRSRQATNASLLASAKLEELLSYAYSTATPCTATSTFTSSASAVTTNNVSLTWTVPTSGLLRTVQVRATYKIPGGTRTDTLTARVAC